MAKLMVNREEDEEVGLCESGGLMEERGGE